MRSAGSDLDIAAIARQLREVDVLAPLRLELFGLFVDEAIKHETTFFKVMQSYLDGEVEPRFHKLTEQFIDSSSIPREAIYQILENLIDQDKTITLSEIHLAVSKHHLHGGITYDQVISLATLSRRYTRDFKRVKLREDQALMMARAMTEAERER
jgi:hypothetical protein